MLNNEKCTTHVAIVTREDYHFRADPRRRVEDPWSRDCPRGLELTPLKLVEVECVEIVEAFLTICATKDDHSMLRCEYCRVTLPYRGLSARDGRLEPGLAVGPSKDKDVATVDHSGMSLPRSWCRPSHLLVSPLPGVEVEHVEITEGCLTVVSGPDEELGSSHHTRVESSCGGSLSIAHCGSAEMERTATTDCGSMELDRRRHETVKCD